MKLGHVATSKYLVDQAIYSDKSREIVVDFSIFSIAIISTVNEMW